MSDATTQFSLKKKYDKNNDPYMHKYDQLPLKGVPISFKNRIMELNEGMVKVTILPEECYGRCRRFGALHDNSNLIQYNMRAMEEIEAEMSAIEEQLLL